MSGEHTLTILCQECGQMVELKDPEAYLLALHLVNNCPATAALVPQA